jgi:hypothetical protein
MKCRRHRKILLKKIFSTFLTESTLRPRRVLSMPFYYETDQDGVDQEAGEHLEQHGVGHFCRFVLILGAPRFSLHKTFLEIS